MATNADTTPTAAATIKIVRIGSRSSTRLDSGALTGPYSSESAAFSAAYSSSLSAPSSCKRAKRSSFATRSSAPDRLRPRPTVLFNEPTRSGGR